MCLFLCADKNKKAKKALQWLRGKNADVTQEFSEIEKANHMGKNEEMPGYLSLFSKMYSKPLLISMGLMLFQQLSGINAVIFYTVKIFKVRFFDAPSIGIGRLNLLLTYTGRDTMFIFFFRKREAPSTKTCARSLLELSTSCLRS